ncbi:MAG TPA: metallopeptidase TldD-related protein [Candidatus Limnocylindria bacterium]|nr:metallopeptidase TldD-related protein [Candidatus Limnocylindria bacterium]
MDRRILDAVRGHAGIADWTLRMERSRGVQIYLVGTDVESVREVSREAYEVDVYHDHAAPAAAAIDGGLARGGATLPLSLIDVARLRAILDEGVTMASLVSNRPWAVPEPAPLPEVELTDARLVRGPDAMAAGIEAAGQIRELAERERASGVRLSGAELFLSYYEQELANSRGIAATSTSTRILMEITLLARGAQDETEYFRQTEGRRLEDLNLADAIAAGAQLARDKLRASAPRTRHGPVLIGGQALNQMMIGQVRGVPGAHLFQASARTAYENLSRFELGGSVYGEAAPVGDLLTMRANALRPHGGDSYRWDADGVPGRDLLVIEDGVLRNRPASQRFAQYLGLPATGRPGVAEMASGTRSMQELRAGNEPVLEVLDFSASNVESLSGDFGMEIRVAYEWGPDGARPISGGSVTGNLFEAMADARFSSETAEFARFVGPAAIRFAALQVAGED